MDEGEEAAGVPPTPPDAGAMLKFLGKVSFHVWKACTLGWMSNVIVKRDE